MKTMVLASVVVAFAGCGKSDYELGKKRSEASLQLMKLGKDLKAAYMQNDSFPKGKAATLPESDRASCCGGPGDKCKVSSSWASDPIWSLLEFKLDEPSMFRYSYESTDGLTFTATAVGDLDCDGKTITYTLTGMAKDGAPSTNLVEPPKGAY